MTDSFVTQCPHCQTSFRVNYAQLSAARGVVRCGSCLQVFNAARQLLEKSTGQSAAALFGEVDEPGTPAATSAAAAAPLVAEIAAPVQPNAAPAALAHPHTLQPGDAQSPNSSAPPPSSLPGTTPTYHRVEPISQRRWAAAAEIDLDHLDLDDALAQLERRQAATGDEGQRPSSARNDQLSARRDDPEPINNDFDDDLDDSALDQPAPGDSTGVRQRTEFDTVQGGDHPAPRQAPSRAEPSLTRLEDEFDDGDPQPPAATLIAVREPPSHEAALRERAPRQRRSAIEAADDSLRRIDAPPLKPAASTATQRAEPRLRDTDLPDLSEDPLQLQWEKTQSSWGKRLLWTGLSLLAALALLGQYAAYHFDELARQDGWRPWFQTLCPVVGCDVPSKVDIALIKSSNLVVRSHPQFNGALIVDAIIYNRAPFAQPFPLLELRFADLDGKLIASRRFKPSEYLSGDLAGQSDMPPQTPIHIALDILDPGSKAVNYSLSFQSPD